MARPCSFSLQTPLSSFQSKQATERVSGLCPASIRCCSQPSPTYVSPSKAHTGPLPEHYCFESLVLQMRTAKADRDTAAQGHTASAWQSRRQGLNLSIPTPILVWTLQTSFLKLPHTFRGVGIGAQEEHCGAPVQALSILVEVGVQLVKKPCAETQVTGHHFTSLSHWCSVSFTDSCPVRQPDGRRAPGP